MINKNLEKTRLTKLATVMNKDYKKCLEELKK